MYLYLFFWINLTGSAVLSEEILSLQFLPKLNTIQNSTQLFPHILLLKVLWSSKSVVLNLEKAPNVNLNTPIEFSHEDIKPLSTKNVAFYQDVSKQSIISMVGIRTSESSVSLKLHGSFVFEGETHEIRPEYLETPSAGLFSDEDLHGTHVSSQHVIHKRSLRTQEDAVLVDADLPLSPVYNVSLMQNGRKSATTTTFNTTNGSIDINSRVKRSTGGSQSLVIPSYHVDLEFILDFSVWQFWLEYANGSAAEAASHLRYFYLHVIAGMDMAYKTIQPEDGFIIACFLSRIIISQTEEQLESITGNTGAINSFNAITILRDWNANRVEITHDPDHTMLFTKRRLENNNGSPVLGIAFVSGICQRTAVSIVQQNGMQRTWLAAAHELGHNLGAPHDANTNDQFIMTASFESVLTPTQLTNSFMFSNSTKETIRNLLTGTGSGFPRVCLFNRICNHTLPITNEEIELIRNNTFTVDEQCRFITDFENSTLFNPDQDRSQLCSTLECTLPGNATRSRSPGLAQYTECGENKFCLSGSCVNRTTQVPFPPIIGESSCVQTNLSTELPNDCVQAPNAVFFVGDNLVTCDVGIPFVPHACFVIESIRALCCETCSRLGLVNQVQHTVTIPPLDGMWSEWSPYAGCSVSCGNGTQQRTRTCTNPAPRFGGEGCDESPTEMQDCSTPVSCNGTAGPVDGHWSEWTSFSSCTNTCGGQGIIYRTRTCTTPAPLDGGRFCLGTSTDVRACE